jgi:hypothetical protein
MEGHMPEEKVQISALIPRSLRARLQHASIDTGHLQSDIVANALTEYLDKNNL